MKNICLILLAFICLGQTSIMAKTPKKQQLWTGSIFGEIKGYTAQQVWPVLNDYCNLYKYFPVTVSFCADENLVAGAPPKLGQSRYLVSKVSSSTINGVTANSTFIMWEEHILTAFDPKKFTLTYKFGKNNEEMDMFVSTMRVVPQKYGCKLTWEWVNTPTPTWPTEEIIRSDLNDRLQIAVSTIIKFLPSSN